VDRHDVTAGSQSPADETLHLGPLRLEAHRAIYGTIVVMTAISLVDETETGLWPLVAAVLGPLTALAAAHAFSDLADRQIAVQRPLRGAEIGAVARGDAQYLLVAILPLVVMVAAVASGWNVELVADGVLVLGMVSLAFWGAFAAARAQLSTRWQVLYALGYGATGLVVVVLELVLSGH
jgi:hypothetical protein